MRGLIRNFPPSNCRPIVDAESEIVFASLVGRPRDKHWDQDVNEELIRVFDIARDALHLNKDQTDHRRGAFPAVHHGVTNAQGAQVSVFLRRS